MACDVLSRRRADCPPAVPTGWDHLFQSRPRPGGFKRNPPRRPAAGEWPSIPSCGPGIGARHAVPLRCYGTMPAGLVTWHEAHSVDLRAAAPWGPVPSCGGGVGARHAVPLRRPAGMLSSLLRLAVQRGRLRARGRGRGGSGSRVPSQARHAVPLRCCGTLSVRLAWHGGDRVDLRAAAPGGTVPSCGPGVGARHAVPLRCCGTLLPAPVRDDAVGQEGVITAGPGEDRPGFRLGSARASGV